MEQTTKGESISFPINSNYSEPFVSAHFCRYARKQANNDLTQGEGYGT